MILNKLEMEESEGESIKEEIKGYVRWLKINGIESKKRDLFDLLSDQAVDNED